MIVDSQLRCIVGNSRRYYNDLVFSYNKGDSSRVAVSSAGVDGSAGLDVLLR